MEHTISDDLILNWLSSLTEEQLQAFNTFCWNTEFCGDVRDAAIAAMANIAEKPKVAAATAG